MILQVSELSKSKLRSNQELEIHPEVWHSMTFETLMTKVRKIAIVTENTQKKAQILLKDINFQGLLRMKRIVLLLTLGHLTFTTKRILSMVPQRTRTMILSSTESLTLMPIIF
jgi:hypothetical protein